MSESRDAVASPLRRPGIVVLIALGLVGLLSLGLHLWGIGGDLPYAPDVDEPIFIRAAVGMLQHRSLDPGWFGNPGSTTIYPAAALIGLWFEVAHLLPLGAHGPALRMGATFAADPTPFYLIGRLISVAYAIAAIFATWLVARRIVGDAGGVLAAAFLPITGIVVAYGQLVRTDTAGLFFALVSLWLILRAVDRGRLVDWTLAAASIGFAMSTRYFFATLIVPYVVAVVLATRTRRTSSGDHDERRAGRLSALAAFLVAPVAFAVTSPFVFLDLRRTIDDVRFEARTVHPGADGLTPLGNLGWYVATVAPSTFGLAALALAAAGTVIVLRRNLTGGLILLSFALSYLIGVSASPLHWDRYVIPLVPIVGIFVAASLLGIGEACARLAADRSHAPDAGAGPGSRGASALGSRRALTVVVASVALIVLAVPAVSKVAAGDRVRAQPSTRIEATEWVAANLGTARFAEEPYCTYLGGTTDRALRIETVADRSLDAYRADGYDYLLTSSSISSRYTDPSRYPVESAFYRSLAADAHLIKVFQPGPDEGGPRIEIYDIRAR